MGMGLLAVALLVVAAMCIWIKRREYARRFQHIPGPQENWLLGNVPHIDAENSTSNYIIGVNSMVPSTKFVFRIHT